MVAVIFALVVAPGVVVLALLGAGVKQKGLAGAPVATNHSSHAGLADLTPLRVSA